MGLERQKTPQSSNSNSARKHQQFNQKKKPKTDQFGNELFIQPSANRVQAKKDELTVAPLNLSKITTTGLDEKQQIQMNNALRVLKEIDSAKFNALNSGSIIFDISTKKLNKTDEPEPGVSFTYGQTTTPYSADYGLGVASGTDVDGEIIAGDITRFRTFDEQEKWRADNPGKDIHKDGNGNKVVASPSEALAGIALGKKVGIEIDPHSFKWHTELTSVLGHELYGHAYHDAISDILEGWTWSTIGDPNKGGHDANNTSGIAATAAEKVVEKGYRKAKKAIKDKGEWEK